MVYGYNTFQVDIKNLKFESAEGEKYSKTAIIKFQVETRTSPIVELMGYVEEEDIFKMIDEGKPIILDQCYVTRFSLENYRATRKLEPKEKVTIKGFRAHEAFFDSSLPFDFTDAIFDSGDFDLTSSWFHRGKLNFDSTEFECKKISFHDVHIGDYNFEFKNVRINDADVDFRNTVFGTGIKDFQYTEFGKGELSFTNTEFNDGDVSFINAQFGGETNFKVARFGEGKVDFHYAKFKNSKISFERTEFGNGRVDFRTVEFGRGKVNFNRAEFGDGEVSFEASEMQSGKFSFKRALFGTGLVSFDEALFIDTEVSFERTVFGHGTISFYKSKFESLSFRFCHLDDYVDLRLLECKTIDLSDTIVRDIIDLNPYEFELKVEQISFAGMRLIGRIYIDWKRNHVRSLIVSQKDTNQRVRAEQFRILKENFSSCGQYEDEDRSYVEFKRHEARANLKDTVSRNKINAIWSYPLHWFKLVLFDRAGLYATSPFRVLITMLSVFVIFSLVYVVLILTTSADIKASVPDSLSVVARSFYHSAITFLTIGYGDHFPYHSIRWVSSLEGFAGLFLMSYFTVAFVRKVLR
ncbi:potassium channel family protein [Bacteroidota bacterium]